MKRDLLLKAAGARPNSSVPRGIQPAFIIRADRATRMRSFGANVTAGPRARTDDAPADRGAVDRLRALADDDDGDALRPYLVGPDKLAYAPEGLAGAIAYGRAGRVLIGIGDPIGPQGWRAFDRFLGAAQRRSLIVGVYQVTPAAARKLARRGMRVVPVGREAVIDLGEFDLTGSRRSNLRHTVTRARRGGVSVEWHPAGLGVSDRDLFGGAESVDRVWSEAAGPPMGFTISGFGPDTLRNRPIAIALDADRHLIAFATFLPCGRQGYVLDLIRRRPGSTPGALEACIAEAGMALARAGATTLSLGLAPLAGLDGAGDQAEERWLARAADLVRNAYDVDGLTFFKGKFDPEWRTRYLAYESTRLFPLVAGGLLWLHLAGTGRGPAAVAAGVASAIGRSIGAQARTMWERDGLALQASAKRRGTVAGAAATTMWLGARFGAGAGRRAAVVLGAVAMVGVAAVPAGSRRSRALLAEARVGVDRSLPLPRITVLVPARNEEAVLPRLILDLAVQDHRDAAGCPLFNVIVVDDRSTDQTLHRTLAAARQGGIEGVVSVRVRRGRDLPTGKGAALTFVPPADCEELLVVLDADARLEPTVLREVASLAASGVPALTLRRRVDTSTGSWLAQVQADEQALDAAAEEARWAFGGAAQFRGNGIVIRRELLIAAGGWRAVITEDLDLAARLAARTGVRVAWPDRPCIEEQPVLHAHALWRQRVRWAEGAIRAAVEWTPSLVGSSSVPAAGRLERLGYVAQLLLPFAILSAAVSGLRRRRPVSALMLPAVAGAVTVGICFDAIRGDAGELAPALRDRLARSIRVAGFLAIWLAAVPRAALRIAIGRGPLRYEQTGHPATFDAAPDRGTWSSATISSTSADGPGSG